MYLMKVSVDLVAHAINKSSFNAEKNILVNIIAGLTNSSRSDVYSILRFSSKFKPRSKGHFDEFQVSNISTIMVSVQPRDRTHKKYTISKMNLSIALLEEMNLRMRNETTETNINVID